MRRVRSRSFKNNGYVLALFAMTLGILLSIAALAVDLSSAYIWRLRVERAAKAGAFAGIQFRSLKGWSYFCKRNAAGTGAEPMRPNPTVPGDTTPNQYKDLKDFVSSVVTANLAANPGFQGTAVVSSDVFDCQSETLTATVTFVPPTLFMRGVLPLIGASGGLSISYSASASLDPAAVALILDTSGSMNCPNSDCSCRTTNTCATTGRTIDSLVTAVAGFREYFNPFRDYIAIIPFNLSAAPSRRFSFLSGGSPTPWGNATSRYNDFVARTSLYSASNTSGLDPKSNTNICDGLIGAIDELTALNSAEPSSSRTRKFTVLFTDGAPNAMRGAFNPQVTAANNPPASPLTNDWYEYVLEWRTAAGVLYRGPGPLVNTTSRENLFGYLIRSGAIAPPGAQMCGSSNTSTESSFGGVLNADFTPAPSPRGCLGVGTSTTIDFSIPGTGGTFGVQSVPLESSPALSRDRYNFARIPYFCAIEAADYIRNAFTSPVFVIGVGRKGNDCSDPFENVDNPLVRKDNFMIRLAADPEFADNVSAAQYNFQQTTTGQMCNCDNVTYPCTTERFNSPGYTPISSPVIQEAEEGEYYGTASAEQIGGFFAEVAKSILLRLNS